MVAREIKRKQYASSLFHLTAAEIAEEEALYIEVKRMEQNEKRYRSDRDDLMRTVMGLDSGLINLDQANSEGVLGLDKVNQICRAGLIQLGRIRSERDRRKGKCLVRQHRSQRSRRIPRLSVCFDSWLR